MSQSDRMYPGDATPHESAFGHVTGEAVYVDDVPEPAGLLHAMVLGSPHPHARITGADLSRARAMPGIHAALMAADVPGHNQIGPVLRDEPLLAQGEVCCVGQPVAVVYGESRELCRAALDTIEVTYEVLPAITDIAAGIAAGAFHGEPHRISRGDAAAAIRKAPRGLRGTLESGGQDHFYLETHCALAEPTEGQTVRVLSSTQHPSEVQALVAEVLGWGRHRVVVECTRMGGAFGGKETQAAQFACLAALGAVTTGRPVKCWLDRDTDMSGTGRRHPFYTEWEVGFDDDGRILGFRANLYADGGWAADLSLAILDRGLFHIDNAYFLPDVVLLGQVVRTNRISNTAFRGFGGPQGMCVIEHVMERVAAAVGRDPLEVRRRNFYGDDTGWHTPYRQRVERFHLPQMVDRLVRSAQLEERRARIEQFNASGTWRRRAIALTPVKFGISFTASFLNQAGALVVLYSDGTVQLNHGGTEMGQGLYTKMLAVCARSLGVDADCIRHMVTTTDKVPNTSATAASAGADLNGEATRRACAELVERLRPVAATLLAADANEVLLAADRPASERPDPDAWAWVDGGASVALSEVCAAAYMQQIPLSATGFYRTPDIAYDRAQGYGKPFHYYAFGVGVSEVEVNGLTGEWRLLRVDILHDVGASLSPDIDRGQVEGGFIQGLGWMTWEELVFDDHGALVTHSPSTYKIPAIGDVPVDFRVELLPDAPQPGVVYGSKAVGEPPFMLAIGTHVAISRAAAAFGGQGVDVAVAIPATHEAILFAVEEARSRRARREAAK